MLRVRNLSMAFLAAVLVSCATPYQEKGFTGGYTESRLNDSAYLVSFYGNGHTSKDRVWYFWLYRCAELTLQKGYSMFLILPKDLAPPKQARADGGLIAAVYRPRQHAHLIKARSSGGGGYTTYYSGGGGSITFWNSSAIVVMLGGDLPDRAIYAIDAKKVIAELQDYVTSNGSTSIPSRQEVLRQSYITHAQLDFGTPVIRQETGAATAVPDSPSDSVTKPTRSAEEMISTLQDDVLQFHAAYQNHMASSPAQASGKVVFTFDVSSYGIVGNCRVVSSTFSDPGFAEALRTRIAQVNFGVRDVTDTTVVTLPMTFSPAPQLASSVAVEPRSFSTVPTTILPSPPRPAVIPNSSIVATTAPATTIHRNQRALTEVQVVLDFQKPSIDRAVSAAIDGTPGSGVVVVNFVVEPNGVIDQLGLVSTSFSDRQVVASVLGSLQKIQLQGKDVAPLSVTNYSVHVN